MPPRNCAGIRKALRIQGTLLVTARASVTCSLVSEPRKWQVTYGWIEKPPRDPVMRPRMNHQTEPKAQTDEQQSVSACCICSVVDSSMRSCKGKPEKHSGTDQLRARCKNMTSYLFSHCLIPLTALIFRERCLLFIVGRGHFGVLSKKWWHPLRSKISAGPRIYETVLPLMNAMIF